MGVRKKVYTFKVDLINDTAATALEAKAAFFTKDLDGATVKFKADAAVESPATIHSLIQLGEEVLLGVKYDVYNRFITYKANPDAQGVLK